MYTRSQRSSTLQDYYIYTRWSLVIIFVVLIIICFGSFANATKNEKLRSNNHASFDHSFIFNYSSIFKFTNPIKPDSADIYTSKSVSISTAALGQSFDYTIKVGNKGPAVSRQVLMIDTLPPNIDFQAAVVSNGTVSVNGKIITWTLGDMNVGSLETMTLTVVTVKRGTFRNKAVLKSQTPDCNKCNQATSPPVTVNESIADISIVKIADQSTIPVNSEFYYTLIIKNSGIDEAKLVKVVDTLSENLEYISADITSGVVNWDPNSREIKWELENLDKGEEAEFRFKVKALKPGTLENKASITSSTLDENLANNSGTYVIQVVGLRIPNVFTPDGDSKNDTFVIDGLETWRHNEFTVRNRWGNDVYYKENYKNDWNGSDLLPGTYFYVVSVSNENIKQQVFTGWVLIMKNAND